MPLTAPGLMPGSAGHVRHRFKQTLLYQLFERYYSEFARRLCRGRRDAQERPLQDSLHWCSSRGSTPPASMVCLHIAEKCSCIFCIPSIPGHNSHHRMTITPARRGKGARQQTAADPDDRSAMERHIAMSWARRLKRVFGIDINECEKRRGSVKIIACIEDPVVIEEILSQLKAKEADDSSPITRQPPRQAPSLLLMWEQGLVDCPARRQTSWTMELLALQGSVRFRTAKIANLRPVAKKFRGK